MSTTNLLSVRFFVRQNQEKNGRAPIYVRISVEGRSADVSLKRRVEISNWNVKRRQAQGLSDETVSINAQLDRVRIEIFNAYGDLKFHRKPITAKAVKDVWC